MNSAECTATMWPTAKYGHFSASTRVAVSPASWASPSRATDKPSAKNRTATLPCSHNPAPDSTPNNHNGQAGAILLCCFVSLMSLTGHSVGCCVRIASCPKQCLLCQRWHVVLATGRDKLGPDLKPPPLRITATFLLADCCHCCVLLPLVRLASLWC